MAAPEHHVPEAAWVSRRGLRLKRVKRWTPSRSLLDDHAMHRRVILQVDLDSISIPFVCQHLRGRAEAKVDKRRAENADRPVIRGEIDPVVALEMKRPHASHTAQ